MPLEVMQLLLLLPLPWVPIPHLKGANPHTIIPTMEDLASTQNKNPSVPIVTMPKPKDPHLIMTCPHIP